jgi:methylated-DNA-[protein]-cysteine S-methyltransferase
MILGFARMATPMGGIEAVFDDAALLTLEFEDRGGCARAWLERRFGTVELAVAADKLGIVERLHQFFGGNLHALRDLSVRGYGTPFQEQIWSALRRIPPGSTTTYGALATEIGRPNAHRAVGAANGANPVAIVVPCHRLIGHDGHLTGYGGGLARKRWLLRHEGAVLR